MHVSRESTHELARLAAKGEVYEMLEPLRLREDIHAAELLAYEWLLMEAGPRGGKLCLTLRMLGAQFGREPRAADKWYKRLIALGLVETIASNAGRLELWVYTPSQAAAPQVRRPDPQHPLAFEAELLASEFEEEPVAAGRPSIPIGRSDLCAHKGPTPIKEIPARALNQSNQRIKAGVSIDSPSALPASDLSARKGPTLVRVESRQPSPAGQHGGVTSVGEVLATMQAGRSLDEALAVEAQGLVERLSLAIWSVVQKQRLNDGAQSGFTPVHARKAGEMLAGVGATLDDVAQAAKRLINRRNNAKLPALNNAGGYWRNMLVSVAQQYHPHVRWPADAPPPGTQPRRQAR